MKKISTVALICAGFVGTAIADVPKKVPLSTYSLLWNRSLFTTKPPPPPPPQDVSAFEDWALTGLSRVSGGYMVTLMNIKKQGETQVIRPDRVEISNEGEGAAFKIEKPGENGNFSFVRVEYSKNDWRDTKVILAANGKTGSVEFKPDLLTPKTATPPPQTNPAQPPGAPPGAVAPQPQAAPNTPAPNSGGRVPRSRVPTPQGGGGRR